MRIAVQGCSHGELDNIYASILQSETETGQKVDLLICCGDFQACRNEYDMRCMKVPKKHAHMGTFWEYYSGKKTAPIMTIFIGGNHEASNHLWELYYGGWVAPRIYYLGSAGVINVGGLRIGGVSGIYKKYDYHKGHFETVPFEGKDIVSVFHIRSLEVMRCKSLRDHIDIFLSHDWPIGVYDYGDVDQLVRFKPFFEDEIISHTLGSPPAAELLEALQPSYWFAGHLHCKFTAVIPHDDFGKNTRFLALDKCLPKRRFLQILDIGKQLSTPPVLEYDLEWLTVLSNTVSYYNPVCSDQKLPSDVEVTEEDKERVKELFGSLIIPENFTITAPIHAPGRDLLDGYQPGPSPQTLLFCEKLGVKCDFIPEGSRGLRGLDDFNITHDSDANMTLDRTLDSSINVSSRADTSVSKSADSGDEGNMMFNFSAPEIKESPVINKNKKFKKDSKCSTPVVMKRRLTLPPPKNTLDTVSLSPIKPDKVVSKIKSDTSDTKSEGKSEIKSECEIVTFEIKSESKTGTVDKEEEEKKEPSNPAITPSPVKLDLDSVAKIDEDFDLDETDDDLISKFLSLKKKFGRDQLSDSMIGNTSVRDVIDEESVKKEDEITSNKKFKMEIHNDLDD